MLFLRTKATPTEHFTAASRWPDARKLYAFLKDLEPVQVGFIRNGITGCT